MAKPFVFFIFFLFKKLDKKQYWYPLCIKSLLKWSEWINQITLHSAFNYFGKKVQQFVSYAYFFFVRTDPRNAQSQSEGNTKIFLSCYFFVSAVLDFQLLVHMLTASLNTSKKMKDKFTFWTFFVGYNTLNLQSIFITISFLTQMTYCWSKGEDLQHFMELTKIYFQYLISNTAIAEIIEVWVIYFEYD